MSTAINLTLRHRRILRDLGKPRPEVDTPYVDGLRVDAIVAQEIAKTAKQEIEGPPKPTRRVTLAAARELGARMYRVVGAARFSWAGIGASAGAAAIAVALAVQPVIDEAERARAVAEANAQAAAMRAVGHTSVAISGRPEDIARYSAAIAADLKQGIKR